jgi:hypothetical protein
MVTHSARRLRTPHVPAGDRAGRTIHAVCLSPMFFTGKSDDALHVIDLPDASPPCELSDQTEGGLATVLGRPTYIESRPLDLNGRDSLLLVVPWLGTTWGPS